jgi:hypothetical protein
MEEVIHYLDLKNQYYEKFQTMTAKFLESANQERWDDIESFVDNRERILNIIRSFDFKIAQAFDQVDMGTCDVTFYRPRVKAMLDKRIELAHKIVALDLELISKMDELKSDTIRELKRTVETTHQMSAFDVPGAARRAITKTKDA